MAANAWKADYSEAGQLTWGVAPSGQLLMRLRVSDMSCRYIVVGGYSGTC